MTPPAPASGGQVRHYGWRIVWAAFLIQMTCSGLTIYGLSVYLHAIVHGDRFSVTEASFASGTFTLAMGIAGLGVGRLLRDHDIRSVMSAGAVLMAAALALLPFVGSLWALHLFYAVLGVGYACTALIPCTTLVTRWFVASRSSAMSIAATGNSFGAIAITPAAALLIGQFGLDVASRWLALLMLAGTLPLIAGVLVPFPADRGWRALGAADDTPAAPMALDATGAVGGLYRSRFFVVSTLAFALGMAAHVGGQTHLYNRVMLATGDAALAGFSIALMAGSSVAARFAAVAALRHWTPRTVIAALLAAQGLALAVCGLTDQRLLLLTAIAVYGGTLGNFITMQTLIIADAYGVARYAQVYAMSRFLSVFGVLAGPGLMGALYQGTGDYLASFVTVGAISGLGVPLLLAAGERPARSRPD